MNSTRQLVRPYDDRMIGGVCAGISDYFGIDPTIVRLLTMVLTVFGVFTPVIAYAAAWVLIPSE